ncbi:MAG: tRNA(Glu)-specific nuclease WapA [Luteibacter sp.]|uniref:RHS repeat-associated core domain-containing protein n=1 Tax=Luteibacter sp. TaxID=1886636 RepID=UPI001385B0E1|nr:RHS repeat-associated core domain-containing protein [Luteibacter sp.]KAF1005952.1 MAG: tRNA(Glu)-specific nuclease WapA [Luteibacter sp.]
MGLTHRFRLSVLSLGLLAIGGLSIGSIIEAQSSIGVDMVVVPSELTRHGVVAAPIGLPDGRVLSVDGKTIALRRPDGSSLTVPLPSARIGMVAVALPDGRILLWGGAESDGSLATNGWWLDPVSLRFTEAVIPALSPGLGQAFTVLSDGRVLVTGGWNPDRRLFGQAALWSPVQGIRVELVTRSAPRFAQSTAVQVDGSVLIWGGVDASFQSVDGVVRFDPSSLSFDVPAKEAVQSGDFTLLASTPGRDQQAAPVDSLVGMRFSGDIDPTTISPSSVSLVGPSGPVDASVSGIQDRLAFVVPRADLFPGTHYTVVLAGIRDRKGRTLPFTSFGFTTARMGGSVVSANGAASPTQASGHGSSAAASSVTGATTPSLMTLYQSTGEPATGKAAVLASCRRKSGTGYRLCRDRGYIVDGAWYPGQDNAGGPDGGHWRLNVADYSPSDNARAWKARRAKAAVATFAKSAGTGSIKGKLHLIDGRGIGHVQVSIGSASTYTEADGSFLLVGAPLGRQTLFVDGRPADDATRHYGQFEVGVTVDGSGSELPYTLYLPRILERDRIQLPSPTTYDMVVTHPDMPGLEVNIPAGTVIRDRQGKIVTELAIVPTPADRAPYPVPMNFAVYFSLQPGGASVQNVRSDQPQGITLTYPNYGHVPAGQRASFIAYTPDDGWRAYGAGTVTPDGSQLKAEAGVRLTTLTSGSWDMDNRHPGDKDPAKPDGACCGDPVDLLSGTLVENVADVVLPDVMPVSATRTWHSIAHSALKDPNAVQDTRAFGSWRGDYDLFINGTWGTISVRLPNGTLLSPFNQVKALPGGDGRWEYAGNIASYAGTTIDAKLTSQCDRDNEFECYVVNTPDGTRYYSQPFGGLYEIRDRFDNRIRIVRDAGLVTQVISPNGRYLTFTYNSDNNIASVADHTGRTWTYGYHKLSFPVGAWADGGPAPGSATSTMYLLDTVTYPDQTTTRYIYNENTTPPSSGAACASTVPGTLASVVDRNGTKVVDVSYCGVKVASQSYADGGVMKFRYQGSATEVTDTQGNVRRLIFGSAGYPDSDTRGYGTSLANTVASVHNERGLRVSSKDALGRTTYFNWDDHGNLLSETRLYGTSEAVSRQWTWNEVNDPISYKDELGHVTTMEYTEGCLTGVRDAEGQKTTMVCDPQGQRVSTTDPLGNTTRQTYLGGDPRSYVDPLGQTTWFATDSLGRLISTTSASGRSIRRSHDINNRLSVALDGDGNAVSYSYDNEGHILSVKFPGDGVLSFAYDPSYRLQRRTDAIGRSESWAWTRGGTLSSYTDRKGLVTVYDPVDALGRFTRVTYADGGTVTIDAYDAANKVLQWTDSQDGITTHSFDSLDRLTQESTSRGTVSYTYDSLGRRLSMTADGQGAVTYDYDKIGRLRTISQASDVVTFGYDVASRRTSMTLPNHVVANYIYDAAGQVSGLDYKRGDDSLLGSLSYKYDGEGQIVARGGTLAATGSPIPYISKTSFDLNNRIDVFEGKHVSYDNNGNVVDDGSMSYEWDARQRLVAIHKGAETIRYAYDSRGHRVSKNDNGVLTSYLYDGSNPVKIVQGGVTMSVLNGLSMDEHFAITLPNGRRYFMADVQKSTMALVDVSGSITQSYQYGPYGEDISGGDSVNPFQYAGRENEGLGLYFNRYRYYHPRTGRFISEDPLGIDAGQSNFYTYVAASPLTNVDPMGLGTLAIGPSVSFSLLAKFDLSTQISFSWRNNHFFDVSRWRLGGIFSISPFTQNSSGVGVSGGGVLTYSEANDPSAFDGWSGVVGFSGAYDSVSAGLDVGNIGSDCLTWSLSLGRGVEVTGTLPGEVHAGASWTATKSVPIW